MTINTNIKPNFPVNYPKAFVKAVYLVSTKQPNVLERAFKIDLATLEENDIFNGVLHNTLNVLQKHTAKYLTDADKKKITDSLETRSSKKALSYLYECLCKRQQQYIVKLFSQVTNNL